MACSALEEKINKIKLQNEEIRRRHEEVEADKKNAAKSNALVKMVPSDNWPERKEPSEFSVLLKTTKKQKCLNKEHRLIQHYSRAQERLGKKNHKFVQGDGPPPDPKYNFLADSEREIHIDNGRIDKIKNKSKNKTLHGSSKKRHDNGEACKDAYFKDNWGPQAIYSKEILPEYEAWRAERNKIDEARINRQKTAEGNWRREWDSNKRNIEKDFLKKSDFNRKDSNNFERKNNYYNGDSSGSRTYHGSKKNHNHQDYHHSDHEVVHEYKTDLDNKLLLSPTGERKITATDKSIKVTLHHGSQIKGKVMSVKVNSPSIVGTGRVGPRQTSRVTYSSQSDSDVTIHELSNFIRQKSFDEKTGTFFNSSQKTILQSNQRKKEGNTETSYTQRKEFKNNQFSIHPKFLIKTPYSQRNEFRDQKHFNNFISKMHVRKRSQKFLINKTENLSISDKAIPSKYNPDKSFNNQQNSRKQKVDIDNDNFERNLSKTRNINENMSDNLKNINDSTANNKSANQHKYINSIETIYQNNDNIKINQINQNNEHIATDESINNIDIIDHVQIDRKIDHRISKNIESTEINKNNRCLKNNDCIEKHKDNNTHRTYKNIEKNTTKIENFNILQNIEKKNNEKSLSNSNINAIGQKDNLYVSTEENMINDVSNEHIQILSSKMISENESVINYENTQLKTIELKHKKNESKIVNNEFQKINVDLKTDFLVAQLISSTKNEINTLQEQNLIELDISQNNSVNDSDLIDSNISNESIEFNEVIEDELVNSKKNLSNDSGFIDDYDKFKINFDTSIIEYNDENNTKKYLKNPVTSDSIESTKEIYKEKVEICDIRNPTFNKTTEVIESHLEVIDNKINKYEVNRILENHTKENEIYTIKNINSNLESPKKLKIDFKKINENQFSESSSFEGQSTNIDFEESLIVASNESAEIISNEFTKVDSDESRKVTFNELTQVISDKSKEDTFDKSNKA